MLNHTLFSKNNPSIKYPAWDSDSHFKYLHKQNIFHAKRSYERWVEKENIFPNNLNEKDYSKICENRLNSLLQKHFLKVFEKQRRLMLYIQVFEKKGIKYLFANDRRNGRLWVKIKSYKEVDLINGLKYFSKIRKKNIVILPHLNLLDNFKKLENLESKSKLSIHLPHYIF